MNTVLPFRSRRSALSSRNPESTYSASKPSRSTPIRIDSSVSLYQLITGLESVGLSFRREPGTDVYVISPTLQQSSD